jgi:hypothetical protein
MLDEIEQLLRQARPEPEPRFVRALEERLLARPRRRRARTLVVGLACSGGLAAVLLVLALAGALPLRLGSGRTVSADERCTTVIVRRAERQPIFMVGRAGDVHLRYRIELVDRAVRRCR